MPIDEDHARTLAATNSEGNRWHQGMCPWCENLVRDGERRLSICAPCTDLGHNAA